MIKKLLGHIFGTKYKWGECSLKKLDAEFFKFLIYKDIETGACHFYFTFLWISLLVYLKKGRLNYFHDDLHMYGVHTNEREIVIRFRKGYYTLRYPWSWEWESTEILTQDMKTVVHSETSKNRLSFDDYNIREGIEKLVSNTTTYTYALKRGEIQERIATYHVERRTWHWLCLPLIKMIRTSIDVRFNDEVGERTGSWKGGCTGCGYDIKEGETPLDCLKRMEKERIFN